MTYGIIGLTAEGTDLCDGQTIKTRTLVEEITHMDPNSKVLIADTYNYKKRAFNIFFKIIEVLKKSDVVFILLSRNGMKVIFPVVNRLNTLFKKPILHDCIGGSIDSLIKQHPQLIEQLNKFSVNWVESVQLKKRLEDLGVKKVEYLPNFKRLKCIGEDSLVLSYPKQFRFCTFSRVNEAKGIGRACEAVININTKCGFIKARLEIYGPIEDNYDVVIKRYIAISNGAINYNGVISADKSVEILTGAYALLFPTTFYGEGFPGTIIDAFSAGVPIIATDWHLNGEIIQEGYTGLLYDPEKPEKLEELMEYLMSAPELVFTMRKQCLKEAKRYDPERVMETIQKKVGFVLSK